LQERSFVSTVPFTEARIRAASIYCSDGRFGEQIDEFLHQGLGLPRYDRLAVPGGPACFTGALSVFWEGTAASGSSNFSPACTGSSASSSSPTPAAPSTSTR
jgi:hypothetical protein